MEISQILANGVMAGCIYGLMAASLALIFGVLATPQFALGAHAMIAAYALSLFSGLGYFPGVLLAAVVALVLGALVQLLVFEPLRDKPHANLFIAAFGLLLILQGVALNIFGPNPLVVEPPFSGVVDLFGAKVTYQRILIVIGVFLLISLLNLFLYKTRTGRAIRAVGQNPMGASVVGISARNIGLLTMAIGSMLAGLAGALLAPISQVYPTMGDALVIKAFIIVVMAGMGSINGALLAGLFIGIAESIGSSFLSPHLRDAYAVAFLIAILIFKPSGIFGKPARMG